MDFGPSGCFDGVSTSLVVVLSRVCEVLGGELQACGYPGILYSSQISIRSFVLFMSDCSRSRTFSLNPGENGSNPFNVIGLDPQFDSNELLIIFLPKPRKSHAFSIRLKTREIPRLRVGIMSQSSRKASSSVICFHLETEMANLDIGARLCMQVARRLGRCIRCRLENAGGRV